mmetsp:Transcript_30608/g.71523  ORF Transcript_30608/g.71523 Transcript_30608/m.71523 type:complete len:379 (-) Transcript_30608:28-1164(-)
MALGLVAGLLEQAIDCLSPAEAVPALRCSRSFQELRPKCLASRYQALWIPSSLKLTSIAQLRAADRQLCQCLSWASQKFVQDAMVVSYSLDFRFPAGDINIGIAGDHSESGEGHTQASSEELHSATGAVHYFPGSDNQQRETISVKRPLLEMVACAGLWDCCELLSRRLGVPGHLKDEVEPFLTDGEPVSSDTPILPDLGLAGWRYRKKQSRRRATSTWDDLDFDHPAPRIPLLVFNVRASFDLPGGDGGVHAVLGYVSSEMEFVIEIRDLCEYPVRRIFATRVLRSWEEVMPLLGQDGVVSLKKAPGVHEAMWIKFGQLQREGAKVEDIRAALHVDGWDLELSTMLRRAPYERMIVDSPNIDEAYDDAKQLWKLYVA